MSFDSIFRLQSISICFLSIFHIYRFSVGVGSQNAKGIHMRRGVLNRPEEFNVTIQPVFLMEKKYG